LKFGPQTDNTTCIGVARDAIGWPWGWNCPRVAIYFVQCCFLYMQLSRHCIIVYSRTVY